MNVQEVKNLPDDSWVEDTVIGTISSAKNLQTKNGKQMAVAKLGDDDDTIDLQSFDKPFLAFNGKQVELSGKGMKKETYNGYAKLKIGKGVDINIVGEGPAPVETLQQPTQAAAPQAASHKLTLQSFAEDFTGKLIEGFKVAESIEPEFDGRLALTSEDKRSIAISFVIGASQRGL